MYRVLIVDDELPIREGLLLFAFEKLECVVCGQAENGQKALEFLQANQVDILITDIRMPVMDGLRLIEVTKKSFPYLQYILISCLNDFKPVQHALKLGAVDYILKGTYTDDELASATLKAVSNIKELKKSEAERQKRVHGAAIKLLSHLIRHDGTVSPESAEQLRELGVIGSYPSIAVWTSLRADPSKLGAILEELRIEYQSSDEFLDPPRLYMCLPGGFLLFADTGKESCDGVASCIKVAREKVEALLLKARLLEDVKTECGNHFAPDPISSDEDLARMITGIRSFADYSFYLDQGAVAKTVPAYRPLAELKTDAFRAKMETVPLESFSRFLLEEFREFLLENRLRRMDLNDFAASLMIDYTATRFKDPDVKRLQTGIHAALSIDDLLGFISTYIADSILVHKFNKCIQHAIQFINGNLSRPLSLSIVAERIGISSVYLSALFVRETGKQFSKYVTVRRMETAMELLRKSHYKVYEVSELVGIQSYRYFSRLFKEHTGFAPKDFK